MKKLLILFLCLSSFAFSQQREPDIYDIISEQYRMECGFDVVRIVIPNKYWNQYDQEEILDYVALRLRFRNHVITDVIHEEHQVVIIGKIKNIIYRQETKNG